MRRPLVLLASLLAAGCAAASALAGPSDDARAAADRFLTALVNGDGQTACNLFSSEILERLGGMENCVNSFSETSDDSDSELTGYEDYRVLQTLDVVFKDAHALAVARHGYVTKRAKLSRLVADLRQLEPDLVFAIGSGPDAARGKPPFHVVVDRATSQNRLVLYAESDTGVIWRLTSAGGSRRAIKKAGQGIPAGAEVPQTPPAPEEKPTYSIDKVALADDGTAYVGVTLRYEGNSLAFALAMRQEGGAWKVADILYSAIRSADSS